jgi:thiamine monophosphate kinase
MGFNVSNERLLVSDLGEKRIIREIISPACHSKSIELGVGDDAAIVVFPPG